MFVYMKKYIKYTLISIAVFLELENYRWYRAFCGGIWYRHRNAYELPGLYFDYFWARYGKINRYTFVDLVENYN